MLAACRIPTLLVPIKRIGWHRPSQAAYHSFRPTQAAEVGGALSVIGMSGGAGD
jgi:hypothetical protein